MILLILSWYSIKYGTYVQRIGVFEKKKYRIKIWVLEKFRDHYRKITNINGQEIYTKVCKEDIEGQWF